MSQLPFDSFLLYKSSAFAVVFFNCDKRGNKDFWMVDIEKLNEERKASKSLSLAQARLIGVHYQLN